MSEGEEVCVCGSSILTELKEVDSSVPGIWKIHGLPALELLEGSCRQKGRLIR